MPISLTNPKKQLQKGTQSICTDTLYESAHINHSKVAVVTAATHIQIGRRYDHSHMHPNLGDRCFVAHIIWLFSQSKMNHISQFFGWIHFRIFTISLSSGRYLENERAHVPSCDHKKLSSEADQLIQTTRSQLCAIKQFRSAILNASSIAPEPNNVMY